MKLQIKIKTNLLYHLSYWYLNGKNVNIKKWDNKYSPKMIKEKDLQEFKTRVNEFKEKD